MKKSEHIHILALALLLTLLLFPGLANAANWYIRSGATGWDNGTNWTDAWTRLPATLNRGDTYYIADGIYGGYTFDDAESGTTHIYVKKAIASDHGNETGWDSAYGDGQATFGRIQFTTSYWEWNGQTRTTWKSGHGFKIFQTGTYGIGVEAQNIGNLTIKYTEVYSQNPDSTGESCGGNIKISHGFHDNITISYNYSHTKRGNLMEMGGVDNGLYEYNYLEYNGSDAICHGQAIQEQSSDNMIIRYNIIGDWEGTGGIVVLSSGGASDSTNWDIYGNVFFRGDDNPKNRGDIDNGVIAVINNKSAVDWRIHNNTIINIYQNKASIQMKSGVDQAHSNVVAYNNLWANSAGAGLDEGTKCTNCESDYSYLMSNSSVYSENNSQTESWDASIFTDYTNEDYTLAAATNAGVATSFDTDLFGNTRGADGTWDRGAYEYNDGGFADLMPPMAPMNLQVF